MKPTNTPEAAVEMYLAGMTYNAISDQFRSDWSFSTIRRLILYHPKVSEYHKEITDCFNKGMSIYEISEKYHRPVASVGKILSKNIPNYSCLSKLRLDTHRNMHYTISDADRELISALTSAGFSYASISRKLDLPYHVIYYICKGSGIPHPPEYYQGYRKRVAKRYAEQRL